MYYCTTSSIQKMKTVYGDSTGSVATVTTTNNSLLKTRIYIFAAKPWVIIPKACYNAKDYCARKKLEPRFHSRSLS